MSAGGTLPLPARVEETLLRAAERAHPREACGLLLGRREAEGAPRVTAAREARNVADDPRRAFALDPGDVVALHDEARRLGLEVVGAWHSHPSGDPTPSDEDRAARWPGHALVIVAGGRAHVVRGR